MNLSTSARDRGANAVVQPIQNAATPGKLRIFAGATQIVEFPDIVFGNASGGVVSANTIAPKDADNSGTVDRWELLDNTGALIASGDAGQRLRILTIDRVEDWVTVSGDHTSTFTQRRGVTLHNKNDTTQNEFLYLDNRDSVFDAVGNTTKIYFHADLNSTQLQSKTWTHIHVGELGLDNATVAQDQRVQVDSFRLTIVGQ